MYSKIITAILQGLNGYAVDVEGHLSNGLPAFNIVGLPDTAIKESKERVRSAIQNSGFRFPVARITINLSPANLRKEGSQLDLSIAISILSASGAIIQSVSSKTAFIGELALSGEIVGVPGTLPMAIALEEMGFEYLVLPEDNTEECSGLKKLKIIPVNHLTQVVQYLNQDIDITPIKNKECVFSEEIQYNVDFSDIRGQETLKRAMEIAAAGHHNILIVGPPGSGKTMAAKRMPTILPALTFEESMECTKIYSVGGMLKGLIQTRPFRSPHHTSSAVALIGGGTYPKPGEVSLAHNGILFLDEFPEFQKQVIEALRQPIEDREVTISRANARFTYPSDFLLVASMNPCRCGYFGDETHECKCSASDIQRYLGKISHPILDRIDIHTEVKAVPYDELQAKSSEGMSSAQMRARVIAARNVQRERYKNENIHFNSQLNHTMLKKYVPLSSSMDRILRLAFERYKFSARSLNKILKLTLTIADLEENAIIEEKHLLEAIRFRVGGQKYWIEI